tara:strand:+ start:2367 stop:2555 length:189 start_codon:yes stop_codon:yes gene_type:complete
MKDEQTIKQLEELKDAITVVNKWQDKEDGEKLFNKLTNEFIHLKSMQYKRQLTDLFNEEVNE